MNNPETHCPRCDVRYHIGIPNSGYINCALCGFRYYNESGHNGKYQMSIKQDDLRWIISWMHSGSTDVGTVSTFDGVWEFMTFDCWIPFDTTVEQLKLYLTFS